MLKDVVKKCRETLRRGGIEDYGYEADLITQSVTGYDRVRQIVHAHDELDAESENKIHAIAQKRIERYPLQYILGSCEFYGFTFLVGEGVLIPRDDTEVAVNLCLEYLNKRKKPRVIDLCAGSGAIAVTLAGLTDAEVDAVELSENALYFLKKNIIINKSRANAVKGDVLECHSSYSDSSLDLIVSNPPYIISDEIKTLQPEVRFEPVMALDGGQDGLDFYRKITACWHRKLKSGGALVFELGEGQAEFVSRLMSGYGFVDIKTSHDIAGTERAVSGIKA